MDQQTSRRSRRPSTSWVAASMIFATAIITNSSFPSNYLIAAVGCLLLTLQVASGQILFIRSDLLIRGGTLYAQLLLTLLIIYLHNGAGTDTYGNNVVSRGAALLLLLPTSLLILSAHRTAFRTALQAVITINLALFYVQFALSNTTGLYLDYLKILGIRESKPDLYLDFGVGYLRFRCTGVFHEPGTYASITTLLIASLKLGEYKQRTKTMAFGIASLVLTGSGFGMIGAVLLIGLFHKQLIQHLPSGRHLGKVAALGLLTVAIFAGGQYFEYRFTANDEVSSGLAFRLELAHRLTNGTPAEMLVGRPFSERALEISPEIVYESYTEDNGLIFFLLYHTGILGTLLVVGPLFAFLRPVAAMWCIALLLLKLPLFSYTLWLLFFPVVLLRSK